MSPVTVAIRRLAHATDLPLPARATLHSAGVDLLAAVDAPLALKPLARALVPTGVAIALPEGFEAQVRARSGLAREHGVTVLNGPGTIDADFRGEISVLLANFSDRPFVVERGMRIAQLVVAPVRAVHWTEVAELPESARGDGGFGSTGTGGADRR